MRYRGDLLRGSAAVTAAPHSPRASVARVTASLVLAVAATWGMAAVSRIEWTAGPDDAAQLRLAWRYRSEAVNECRRLTAEEIARLPAHMRREEECERGLRPYRLEVLVNGAVQADDTIHGAGARSDRPLYVYRQFPLNPGRHAVVIRFTPVIATPLSTGSAAAGPHLEGTIALERHQVALVTLGSDAQTLIVRGAEIR